MINSYAYVINKYFNTRIVPTYTYILPGSSTTNCFSVADTTPAYADAYMCSTDYDTYFDAVDKCQIPSPSTFPTNPSPFLYTGYNYFDTTTCNECKYTTVNSTKSYRCSITCSSEVNSDLPCACEMQDSSLSMIMKNLNQNVCKSKLLIKIFIIN